MRLKEEDRLKLSLQQAKAIVATTPPAPQKHLYADYKGKLIDKGKL
jgi:hypothetical protein